MHTDRRLHLSLAGIILGFAGGLGACASPTEDPVEPSPEETRPVAAENDAEEHVGKTASDIVVAPVGGVGFGGAYPYTLGWGAGVPIGVGAGWGGLGWGGLGWGGLGWSGLGWGGGWGGFGTTTVASTTSTVVSTTTAGPFVGAPGFWGGGACGFGFPGCGW